VERLGRPSDGFAEDVTILAAFPFDAFNDETLPGSPNLVIGFRTATDGGGEGGIAPAFESISFVPNILGGTSHDFEMTFETTGPENPLEFIIGHFDGDISTGLLNGTGITILADTPDDADLLLVNTCSIREKAQEKVFSELGRWRQLKEKKPHLKIGVGGCVASQEGEGITRRAPFVDVVFGPQTLHRLPALIDGAAANAKPVVDVSFPEIEKFDRLPEPRAEGPTAFVSVMEGCSKYCSFCVVPYTRGEEISRPFDDVIAEIASLSEQGVREVNLLGQNVNAYRGPMHDGQIADLATLIYYVAAIEGIGRIRFTTSHPVEFTDSLIQAYAEVPKLASYLHLPVQSGSDRILALMKRGHTVLEYKQKIRRLREARPDIALSSDFIVGFPGETEADFEATMGLVEELNYDQCFSFIYSPRPGTPAA